MTVKTNSKMKMTIWPGSDSDHRLLALCQSMYIGALISLLTPATGADPGIFDWGGGPNFGSERTVKLF